MWRTRESHLKEMPGFIRFAMLKCVSACLQFIVLHSSSHRYPFPLVTGTNVPGKYVSETHWDTKDAFEGWAKSSQFKASHGGGSSSDSAASKPRPNSMTMLEGPPVLEMFETVTTTALD